MSMPISVCNDTFKINNVVFLPTKDVKKENHTIGVLEYSDNAVFIVDAVHGMKLMRLSKRLSVICIPRMPC